MAIVHRTLDSSEQRKVFQVNAGAVATGVTGILCTVPYPSVFEGAAIAAFGLSGAPNYTLTVNRFVTGAGATVITIATGTSNTPAAFGTSGILPANMVIAASGSTLLNLLAGDVIMYLSGVANTAVTGLSISAVIRPIQDVKKQFGI